MRYFIASLVAICALWSLTACDDNSPDDGIKPLERRTVLLLKENGEIYSLEGELVKTLPNCGGVTQIIVDKGDYFVSGVSTKDRVGYWKNGKWSTLHVDFIDDIDHWAFGIGKWDSYIFLLDYPHVLKNSGIFRLNNSERFMPAHHGISVLEGECYVVGNELIDSVSTNTNTYPILYTEHKGVYEKEVLPMPDGIDTGEALAIYAYDKKHFIAGGYVGREPAIWVDRELRILPRFYDCTGEEGQHYPFGIVQSIALCNGHIYCGGFEYMDDEAEKAVPTLWCDGKPTHLVVGADEENYFSGRVVEVAAYGDDVYTLTQELYDDDDGMPLYFSALWLNGRLLRIYDLLLISFAVL